MSKILFLTSVYDFDDKGNLYTDLVDTFALHGHDIIVMTPKERKYGLSEKTDSHGHIRCLQFKCLNFRGKVNIFEKGIGTLLLGYQYKHAFKKYFNDEKFDIVIYATLPITYAPIVRYLKHKDKAFTYLLQKDFFPQSAVDLNILHKHSLIYKMFRKIEKGLFRCSDKIGVISPKNIPFLLSNNTDVGAEKVEYCPNGIVPTPVDKINLLKLHRQEIKSKYGIPDNTIVFLYGGVISRSQSIDFIKEVLSCFKCVETGNAFFLIIGSGNGYDELASHVASLNSNKIKIMPYVPKKEFNKIIAASDVGLVFLDNRFTIANVPSRILGHFDIAQPIIAATDNYTDLKEILEDNKIGLWSRSDNPQNMVNNIVRLAKDPELRSKLGNNARKYLENNCTAEIAYGIIESSFNEFVKKNGGIGDVH